MIKCNALVIIKGTGEKTIMLNGYMVKLPKGINGYIKVSKTHEIKAGNMIELFN